MGNFTGSCYDLFDVFVSVLSVSVGALELMSVHMT